MTPKIIDAIAQDAESLAALHDCELTPPVLAALRIAEFPSCLGLMPATEEAQAAWQAMEIGIADLPAELNPDARDILASEYAAIYLTGAYGVSPYESVWTDDDHLVCQEAMFQWRDLHAAAGLAVVDWRHRPDDHLVLQLLYLAKQVRSATAVEGLAPWRHLAQVLDEHTLRWLPDFSSRVAARSDSLFYIGLAVLTTAWLEMLRDLIAAQLGEPRPSREEVEERLRPPRPVVAEPIVFIPGGSRPSW